MLRWLYAKQRYFMTNHSKFQSILHITSCNSLHYFFSSLEQCNFWLQILKITETATEFSIKISPTFCVPFVLVETQRRETVFPVEKPQGRLFVEAKVKMLPTGRWNPSLNEEIPSRASCCGFNIAYLCPDFLSLLLGFQLFMNWIPM